MSPPEVPPVAYSHATSSGAARSPAEASGGAHSHATSSGATHSHAAGTKGSCWSAGADKANFAPIVNGGR